jgi:PKD repeat protein
MKRVSFWYVFMLLLILSGSLFGQDYDPPVIICPTEPIQVTMCGAGTVCVDVPIDKASHVESDYAVNTRGITYCIEVDTSGTYIFTIIAENDYGADTCEITAIVTINEKPVIDCPLTEFFKTICGPEPICLDLPVSDADEVVVEGADWANDVLCFNADTGGVYTYHIVASNGCGSVECDILYNVELLDEPVIACPIEPIDVFLCAPVGVAAELIIENEESVQVFGDASWMNDTLYFETGASGLYEFTVIATNFCGADTCDIAFNVTIGTVPVITCPVDPIDVLLCEGDWANDTLCFMATETGQYVVDVIATDICGADTCRVVFNVEMLNAPIISCPMEPIDITVCIDETFIIPIEVMYADEVTADGGTWVGDGVEFTADESGVKTSTIIASNACGEDTCQITVNLTVALPLNPCFTLDSATSGESPVIVYFGNCTELSGTMEYLWDFGDGQTSTEFEPAHAYDSNGLYDVSLTVTNECGPETLLKEDFVLIKDAQIVIPTTEWIDIYCAEPTLNGEPLAPGDIISAYDPDGVLCGMCMVKESGAFGFMPIYRDDPYSDGDEGADPGDIITIEINFEEVYTSPVIVWSGNGDRIEVCLFSTENCINIALANGWNLISWNVAFESSVEDFIPGWDDCIDIIMGFDQGGLTYNPDLPEYSTLDYLDYYHGYWFYMSCPHDLFLCAGEINPNSFIPVYTGWNLVSYWPRVSYGIEEGFASILDYLLVALGYDGGGLTWLPTTDKFNTLTDLYPGFGYWVKLSQDMNLVYPGFNTPPGFAKPQGRPLVDGIVPTDRWISLYGKNLTVDNVEIEAGSKIEIYSNHGVLCGQAVYNGELLKFTPVYGCDNSNPATSGYPLAGEAVSILIDGQAVYPEITWETNGECVEISNLATKSGSSGPAVPDNFGLAQNYPNPFNPNTTIKFSLPASGHIDLSVYNLLGRKVKTLVDDYCESGQYEISWDATDAGGNKVSSGVYFYRIQAGDYTQTRKMILTK